VEKADAIVFIDANQYIELYMLTRRKHVLSLIEAQRDYIFVTSQLADEVRRRKVEAAGACLADALKRLPSWCGIPLHLLDLTEKSSTALKKTISDYSKAQDEANKAASNAVTETLERISMSKDELSSVLSKIFSSAHPHTNDELERARARKERGNPPGKGSKLGDELTWEQLLSHYKGESKLWIITKDSDYCTTSGSKAIPNAFLHNELLQRNSKIEVFCYNDLAEGIEHFTETTGYNREMQIPAEELKEIKKEQESLPPLGWMTRSFDLPPNFLETYHRRSKAYFPTITSAMAPVLVPGVMPDQKKS